MKPNKKYDNFVPATLHTPRRSPGIVVGFTGGFMWASIVFLLISAVFAASTVGLLSVRLEWDRKTSIFATLVVWSILSAIILPRLIDRFYPEVESFPDDI